MKNIYTGVRLMAASIIFLLFAPTNTAAQNETDFAGQPEIIHDSLYYELFKSNRVSDPKKALSYAYKALELSEKYGHVDVLIKAYNAVGWLYQEEKNYDSALHFHHEGLKTSIKYDKKDRQMYSYTNLGIIYISLNMQDRALDNLFRGLKIAQELNKVDVQIPILNNIGVAYVRIQNDTIALSYYKQSLELMKKTGDVTIDETTTNIGVIHNKLGRHLEAITMFNSVIKSKIIGKSKVGAYYGLALAYKKLNNIEQSKAYAQTALYSANKTDHQYYIPLAYYLLGEIANLENKSELALEYFKHGLNSIKSSEAVGIQLDTYLEISKILAKQHKYKESNEALTKAYALKDSLHREDFAENYKNIHLRLAKEETDQIIERKEAEIEKQAIISKSIAAITVLAVMLLIVLWRGIVIIKRSRKTIATQNTELSVLNQSLETQVEERTRELALSLEKIRMQSEREQSLLRKELNFLKNQFNSHITFNFLNFCYSKVYRSSPDTAEAIDLFATMLRYSLVNSTEEKVSLKQEIAYIENFIELQRLLTAEVFVTFACEGDLENKMILPRILITFIENAFKHGELSNPDEPVRILLRGDEDGISLSVANRKNRRRHIVNTGVGQENVMQILQLNYPGRHALNIEDGEESYVCELTITLTDEERKDYPNISIAV